MSDNAENDAPVLAEFAHLTAAEKDALRRTWDFGPFGTEPHQFAAVERIIAARLAPVLALADEWERAEGPTAGDDLYASLLRDALHPGTCHNGHPFVPGVSTDHAPGESDPRWCNTCGEARPIASHPDCREEWKP